MPLIAGTRLGHYEITTLLGSGGMGEVYRARDLKLQRDVALKVLPHAFTDDPDRVARFGREARVLASLNHPNIAAIYGLEQTGPSGNAEEAMHAIVMELVPGQDLSELVRRPGRRTPATAMPADDVLRIARQIIDALDAAHEQGIVHRDLKPANIRITPAGVVKVLDFGLAKPRADAPAADAPEAMTASAGPTEQGAVMGTAPYMSPEQARGLVVDKRTDIWAFGCVLYELLTGQRTFEGATRSDVLAAVLSREPDWDALPPTTPPALRRLLQHCLEKDPARRLRDIGDARLELEAASERAPAPDAARRRQSAALPVAAIVMGLTAIAFVAWDLGHTRGSPSAPSLGSRLTRVTWDDSFSTEPALSKDGTMVAYASAQAGDGQLDLWLQRVAGGPPLQLTTDPADDRAPDFSPDGTLIAFESDRAGGGIYVMPALKGDARLVAEGGRFPRFSPDGSRIAYWTGPWLGGAGARTGGSAVFTIPAIGGQPPTAVSKGLTAAVNPVWSPDGTHLLFFGGKAVEAGRPATFDWWMAPALGGEPVATGVYPLLAQTLPEMAVNQSAISRADGVPSAWTKDGVVFSLQLGESTNLWRVKLSPTTGTVVAGSLERITNGAGVEGLASADAAGRLAFRASDENVVSLILPLDSNAARPLGPIRRVSVDSGREAGRNSLDEAGRLLVFPKNRANEIELWVKDLGLVTAQERHLVTLPPVDINPIISPDGSRVVYALGNASYVIPVSGGSARKLCDGCVVQGWFGDSRRILALLGPASHPGQRLGVVDANDGATTDVLVEGSPGVNRADITSDGRWLAFQSQRRVWIAPVSQGHPSASADWHLVLSIPPNTAERACGWSPDGRFLYLLLERDGFRDLYAQRVDPTKGTPVGEPTLVQHLHDPRRRWGSSPLGTAIVSNAFVFSQVEATGSIWLLDPTRILPASPGGK